MCTLVVLSETVRDHELVVAANRDEHLARPASPPAVQVGPLPWISPLDRQAGGTWIGVNRLGVFAGLVNRSGLPSGPPVRSRGLLVRDALRRTSAARIAADMDALVQPPSSSFALVYADGRDLFTTVHGPGGTRTSRLGRGIHVICSREPNDLASRKVQRIAAEVAAVDWKAPPEIWKPALIDLLSRHPELDEPLENPCVHREGYGTRSSEILACSSGRWRWWHAEGPPCQTPFTEISHLWEHLQQGEVRGVEDPSTSTEETRP